MKIANAVIHFDEASPHVHVVGVVLVIVSKVYFHNDYPFFGKVLISSRNVWAVLSI